MIGQPFIDEHITMQYRASSSPRIEKKGSTMKRTSYPDVVPYKTKDGSIISELAHPGIHGNG
jgi:hypothetical protein